MYVLYSKLDTIQVQSLQYRYRGFVVLSLLLFDVVFIVSHVCFPLVNFLLWTCSCDTCFLVKQDLLVGSLLVLHVYAVACKSSWLYIYKLNIDYTYDCTTNKTEVNPF